MPGSHNARNAAAALTAARLAGADLATAAAALRDFQGAGRRFERLGATSSGAVVVDDYAHHPTEVAATLEAARTLGPRRVIAVFQPHLFSRTARTAAEFGAALAAADEVVVLDVYPARERAEDFPGVTGLMVAEAVADAGAPGGVDAAARRRGARRTCAARARDGDLVLTLGRGRTSTRWAARSSPRVADAAYRAPTIRASESAATQVPRRTSNGWPASTGSPGACSQAWRSRSSGSALGWLWFRDSSFAAVERVSITGSTSSEEAQVRDALQTAANGMSTLKVDTEALRQSVEPFSSVADLRVKATSPTT